MATTKQMQTGGGRRGLAALAAAGVMVAAAALLVARGAHRPAAAGARGPAAGGRLAWPAGTRATYALAWTSDTRAGLLAPGGEQMLATRLDLAGELALRSFGERDGATLLGVSLPAVERHQLTALGQELLPDDAAAAAALAGREALAEVEADGRVRALRFRPGDPDLWKTLVQWLLADAQVTLPAADAATWEALETSSLGRARARYEGGGGVATRRRGAYETLLALPGAIPGAARVASEARLAWREHGPVVALYDDEAVALDAGPGHGALQAHVTLRLELLRTEADGGEPPALAGFEARRPDAVVADGGAERRLLAKRADGLTVAGLLAYIGTYGSAGRLPDHNRWLWRATGLLLLEPEACARLADLHADPATDPRGRALIADLLAQAGSGAAQAALRAILGSERARHDAGYPQLIERLGMVEHPDAETGRFFAAVAPAEGGPARAAAALSAGAVAGRLARSGDPEEAALADRIHRQLREQAAAAAPGEEEPLLRALGNAAVAEDEPWLASELGSDEAAVRRGAARALRHFPTADATAALAGVVRDADPGVQQAALSALAGRALDDAALGAINQALASGALAPQSDVFLVSLLASQPPSDPRGEALRALLARASGDGPLAARIRGLL
jgi:hypothetical protein